MLAWGLFAAFALLLGAAGYEAFTQRHTKRPLSRHAVSRRRPDDPPLGSEPTDLALIDETLKTNARLADQHNGSWPWQTKR